MGKSRYKLYRLMYGPAAEASATVRRRLLQTIPSTLPALLIYCFTLLLISGSAVYIDGSAWTWVWLLCSLVFIAWRAGHPLWNHTRRREQPLGSILAATASALFFFGMGCAACIATGDMTLTVMSVCGTMGVVSGIGTRWAAVLRLAFVMMAVVVIGPIAVLLAKGGTYAVAGLVLACVTVSIASFALQNYHYLLAAVIAEENSGRLARTDHLTGLANRAELMRQLQQRCAQLSSSLVPNQGFALLYMDLDGFKLINDTHGHAAGDELLQIVAQRLRAATDQNDVIARIGGDEFITLLDRADDLTAHRLSDRLIETIAAEYCLRDGSLVRVGCSIGVALAPTQGRDPEVLLARADSALYDVKHQGKGHSGIWKALKEG